MLPNQQSLCLPGRARRRHLEKWKRSEFVVADRERVRRESETVALSSSYFLDESDPDVLVLRRQGDAFVAAFSARGATREGILDDATEEDHEALPAR